MENTSSNLTVSSVRYDDQLKKSIDTIKTEMNDAVVCNMINKVKRSERLSRKRTADNILVSIEEYQSDGLIKKKRITCKNMQNIKIESRNPESPLNSGVDKINDRVSPTAEKPSEYILNNYDIKKESDVQTSIRIEDNEEKMKMSVKSSLKTLRNKKSFKSIFPIKRTSVANNENEDGMSNDFNESDNFIITRKRGRPPSKKVQLQKTDIVNHCNDEIDKQYSEWLTVSVEKLHNVDESELPGKLDTDNTTNHDNNNKPPEMKKRRNKGKLIDTVKVKTDESEMITSSFDDVDTVPTTSAGMLKSVHSNDRKSQLESHEHDIRLLSKRFNIPIKTIKNIIIDQSISVFRDKYSESVTSDMITVSPIVMDDVDAMSGQNVKCLNKNFRYTTEPLRNSLACEKTNLKDLMEELTKTMPSWSLCIVPDPSRYVISHMSIDIYGTPTANKVVVLDRYFRASVYIYQCLEYKYCKYYTTANEIVTLIKELNVI